MYSYEPQFVGLFTKQPLNMFIFLNFKLYNVGIFKSNVLAFGWISSNLPLALAEERER